MRSEQEIYDLILHIAKEDERIRAVYMNGSRTNPEIAIDDFCDYDIVYVVTNTLPFIKDKTWLKIFGELLMLQEPDSNDMAFGQKNDSTRSYAWLMLFKDFVRIDLQIQSIEAMQEEYGLDSLTVPLFDKDGILPKISLSNNRDYLIKKPTKAEYAGCCNEFFWCLNNGAKGIARDQMPYVIRMYYETVHKELNRMLAWHIGVTNDFAVSVGKWGKYFNRYLSEDCYNRYLLTIPDGNYDHIWKAIEESCRIFRNTAKSVAKYLGCTYNEQDDKNMMEYLDFVKARL